MTAVQDLPYASYLFNYPYPAFLLAAVISPGKGALAVQPKWCNPALASLLVGSKSTSFNYGSNERLATAFISSLSASEVRSFGQWASGDEPKCILSLRPAWIPEDVDDIQLEVVKTQMDDYWVCTTVPKTTLPPLPSTPRTIMQRRSRQEAVRMSLDLNPRTTLRMSSLRGGTMAAMVETFDWASTSLGPRESWPECLVAAVGICLSSSIPSAIWWGNDAVLIYNDAYVATAGSKHPHIFGQAGPLAWSELWEELGPAAHRVFEGESVRKQDDVWFLERLTDAFLPEENYYDWNFRPIYKADGTVGGLLNDCFDTTQKILGRRRMRCLSQLTDATGLTATPKAFADVVLKTLENDNYVEDVPFAAFYFCSAAPEASRATSPRPSGILRNLDEEYAGGIPITLTLSGTIGIPEDHPAAPRTTVCVADVSPTPEASAPPPPLPTSSLTHDQIGGGSSRPGLLSSSLLLNAPADYTSSQQSRHDSSSTAPTLRRTRVASGDGTPVQLSTPPSSCVWPFGEALAHRRVLHVPFLTELVTDGLEGRGWKDKPRETVIIPIGFDDAKLPQAVLVLGVNTRRPYDNEYKEFVDIMRLSLTSTLAATLGREAEVQKAEYFAQLDAAKTVFFSNVSHELRTPLTLIGGPLDDVIADLPNSRMRANLKLAARNVRRLSRIVDSLMDFSRLAANRLEGHFQPVQLGVFTEDLASLFRSLIERTGIQYHVICDADPHQPSCYIDTDFWEKIVFNLIGNAFKYTFVGSITIRIEHTETQAVFTVEDTGIGISQADQERIFERFHRVPSVARSHEGTGIGLALTLELVNLHGGELTVESVTGDAEHGSKFTVKLLLGRDHLPKDQMMDRTLFSARHGHYVRDFVEEAKMWSVHMPHSEGTTPSGDSDNSTSSDTLSTSPGKFDMSALAFSKSDVVLVVDDNPDMRKYTLSILSHYCTVVGANNGREALDIVAKSKPDLILSDVMMPVMDGYALINALRENKETSLIPIIVITAKSNNDETAEGLLSGADDFLAKPFKSSELVARVHLHMNLGKARIELETRFQERTREVAQLLELSPVAILRSARDGSIVYVNPRWYELTGRARGSPLDEWPESVYNEDLDMVMGFWKAIHAPATPDSEEEANSEPLIIDFRWNNGKWCQMQAERTDGGTCSFSVCSLTDITTQRMYEAQKLAHSQEREALSRRRAEDADRQRKEAEERRRGQELLIDVTSHELRQPVSAIINGSSLIRSNMNSLRELISQCVKDQVSFVPTSQTLTTLDEDMEALDSIYQCGLAQERIANDVLSLSRIQLDMLSIRPGPFNLITEIRRICSIFRNEVRMKSIQLSIEFGDSLKMLGVTNIVCDKVRFGQVVTNLLSNAIKFTDTSTDRRNISVRTDVALEQPPDGSCQPPHIHGRAAGYGVPPNTPIYVYVSVADSGPGLDPEDLSQLFQRFQQGTHSHEIFGGSGLGLFVSRSLCDLMGGRIQVDNNYGEGAIFRFFIQSMSTDPTPPPSPSPSSPSNKLSSTPWSPILSNASELAIDSVQYHILITEDNLINQTVLNRQMKKAGCTTELANNGLQCIQRIQSLASGQGGPNGQRQFDAILLDIEMPVMDGLTAVRQIRAMEATGELPGPRNRIIALTGNAREGQIENIRKAGMDAVLIKPYRIEDIMARILSSRPDSE